LTGNTDVFDSNFYLLNPNGSDDFYFIPWDYDDTWGFVTQPDNVAEGRIVPRWKFAPQSLMGSVLHQKFFRQPGAIDLLTEAVEQIKALYFTPQQIQTLLDQYYVLASPLTLSSPDIDHLPSYKETKRALIAEYNEVYQSLVDQLEVNYKRYMLLKEAPSPFYSDTPLVKRGNLILKWREAFDMQGDDVTYDIEVATSPEFRPADIVLSRAGIVDTFYKTPWTLPKGEYFAKIVARDDQDADNHWQYSFAEYEDPKTEKVYPGVVSFIAKVNGTPPSEKGIFRDNFKNRSYENSDGDLDWSTPWIEDDPKGKGATGGMIRIARGKLITNGKRNNNLVEPSVARAANLAGTTAATLSVNFVTIKATKQDVVVVEVSTDEAHWTALDEIKEMVKKQTRSYDMTSYAAENTWIRFRGYNLNSNQFKGLLELGYVEISRD
jgi:hypothetical protein